MSNFVRNRITICQVFVNSYQKTDIFADDAKLYRYVINDEDIDALQRGLNANHDWSETWLLKLKLHLYLLHCIKVWLHVTSNMPRDVYDVSCRDVLNFHFSFI